MAKWIEYQPVIDEIKHEWCNKCNKTCPHNNCKIYRVMQILRRQKAIPHEKPVGEWIHSTAEKYHVICSLCNYKSIIWNANYCPGCGADMRGKYNDVSKRLQ